MEDYTRPPSTNFARPGTAFRSSTGRPESSLRGGTASRLVAENSMGIPSTASGQRFGNALGFAGNMMTERPITQHGLSGLPTSHGRIGTASGLRQVKDKRYWQGILQIKIQEISQETERLIKEKKSLDRDKSAKKLYEKKIKDAAKELTNLQSQLTDMNLALDGYSSGFSRHQLQHETTAYRERNENTQGQLEKLFTERQNKEDQNKNLETEIEKERNKINEMIFSLPQNEQAKYRKLQELSEQLKKQNSDLHNEIEALVKQRDRLANVLSSSQPRMDAVRLQSKLKELLTKRNTLREEEANRLSPAQEREKLIAEVRTNNQALTSITRQMKNIEDQLNEKRELLQQVEQDLEEGNSERHAKYKELKRRDEAMTNFLETFQQSMAAEKQNIENLKNMITYAIEQMTLQGVNMRSYGNSAIFNEKNDLSSQNGLLREYKKLSIQLKQLQILEKRTSTQQNNVKQEELEIISDIQKFSNLDILRNEAAVKMEELTSKLNELRNKKRVTENVVEEAEKRTREIKEHLRSNDNYRQISHLEEKLNDLKKENKVLQASVDQSKKEYDYSDLQRQAEESLRNFMEMLNSDANANNY